jgi:hypothetical protein
MLGCSLLPDASMLARDSREPMESFGTTAFWALPKYLCAARLNIVVNIDVVCVIFFFRSFVLGFRFRMNRFLAFWA